MQKVLEGSRPNRFGNPFDFFSMTFSSPHPTSLQEHFEMEPLNGTPPHLLLVVRRGLKPEGKSEVLGMLVDEAGDQPAQLGCTSFLSSISSLPPSLAMNRLGLQKWQCESAFCNPKKRDNESQRIPKGFSVTMLPHTGSLISINPGILHV